MSSEIIYHQTMTRLPSTVGGNQVDLYFHLIQIGSSNCFETDYRRPNRCGRRSRDWSLISCGTKAQVLNTAIHLSGDCEGGMLKLGNASAYASPETHIRKTRKLLAEAATLDLRQGIFFKGFSVGLSLKFKDEKTKEEKIFNFENPDEVNAFLLAHADRLDKKVNVAWSMANVRGPEMR